MVPVDELRVPAGGAEDPRGFGASLEYDLPIRVRLHGPYRKAYGGATTSAKWLPLVGKGRLVAAPPPVEIGSPAMLGEEEAVVLDVKPFDVHGVAYRDVTIAYKDRSVDRARLGPEGVPENLEAGEIVLATRVANMVVSLRRPS